MSLNHAYRNNYDLNTKTVGVSRLPRQAGFLLPLSLFILVVMGVLALSIARTSSHSNFSSVLELLNVQAFYAGETGLQRSMQVLFPPSLILRQEVDSRCASLAQTYTFTGINGLNLCKSEVSCQCRYTNGAACNAAQAANYLPTSTAAVATSYYSIMSKGSCGQGDLSAQRTLDAGAFLEQE
jgi:MSHA biogenesis protein MshP